MPFNLIDSVRGFLGNDVIDNASNVLGENENNMQKAVSGAIPAVLTGILDKAGSGDGGNLLRIAKETFNSGMLSNVGRFFSDNSLLTRGADLLKGIFGDRLGNVSSMIANYAGIKPGSATALLSAAAPAALGAIGSHAASTNMSTSGFLSFLNNQKDNILNAVPSGLNLAGALGLSSLGSIGSRLTNALSGIGGSIKSAAPNLQSTPRKKTNWFVPALLALALIALIWLFMGKRNNRNENTQSSINMRPDSAIASAPPVTRAATPASIMVQLPNGTEINAYKGGIEDQLVRFLNDPSQKVDKNTWFDFDNVNFKTGSADIMPESMTQIKNIAAIMKAFPHTAIKIGGYTDKTGNEKINLKLSQARAEAVHSALKNDGVPESQLSGAEGYGSQYAKVAADAPDEERKADRRMAVNVRQK
jgi:outer membrane protein OmpA-like peptidoglycan-associated protein